MGALREPELLKLEVRTPQKMVLYSKSATTSLSNLCYNCIEKLPHGKNAREIAKAVIRLLYAYRLTGVLTITTDNGSGLSAHQEISRDLKGVVVYFSDSYCSWQNGLVEYTNKLIRQHIPKGTDFATITAGFVKEDRTSSTGVREKN